MTMLVQDSKVASGWQLGFQSLETELGDGVELERMRRARGGNAANTNVVFHGGRLLALWEAGLPHRLDPVTLETLGPDRLGGALGPGDTFSAHPKLDRSTGDMWNFGVTY